MGGMVRLPPTVILSALAALALAQIGCGSDKAASPPPVAVDSVQ
jgi:hypothetical protein